MIKNAMFGAVVVDSGTLIPIGAALAIISGIMLVVWRISKKDSSFEALMKEQGANGLEILAIKREVSELRSKIDRMHGEQQAAALGRHEKLESRIAALVEQLERNKQ